MNERIKELLEQAGLNTLTTKGNNLIVDGCFIVSPNKLEHFVELIVEECIFAINEQCKNTDAEATIEAINILGKLLGVEE